MTYRKLLAPGQEIPAEPPREERVSLMIAAGFQQLAAGVDMARDAMSSFTATVWADPTMTSSGGSSLPELTPEHYQRVVERLREVWADMPPTPPTSTYASAEHRLTQEEFERSDRFHAEREANIRAVCESFMLTESLLAEARDEFITGQRCPECRYDVDECRCDDIVNCDDCGFPAAACVCGDG